MFAERFDDQQGFEEKVMNLVDVGASNLWGHLGCQRHVMRCVGGRCEGEVHGGGRKR